jgi:hypothetical protein
MERMMRIEDVPGFFARLDAIHNQQQTFIMSRAVHDMFRRMCRPKRLRGVELMRKVRKAWPIWATMHAQGRVRALPHEATRIQRRDAMRRRRG